MTAHTLIRCISILHRSNRLYQQCSRTLPFISKRSYSFTAATGHHSFGISNCAYYHRKRGVQPLSSGPLIEEDNEYHNYGEPSFWDKTYAKETAPLEWYQSYSDMASLIKKYIPPSSRVLMAGCGNAEMSEDMVKDGYQEIVNIDNSSVVIEAMQKKYQNIPQLKYTTMDVLDLSFEDCTFDSVIDKGTLDAIMCVEGGPYNVPIMISEINRVLKPGGVYMLITTGLPKSRMPLLNIDAFGWKVTLYIIPKVGSEAATEGCDRPYYEPVLLNEDGNYTSDLIVKEDESLFVFLCKKPQEES